MSAKVRSTKRPATVADVSGVTKDANRVAGRRALAELIAQLSQIIYAKGFSNQLKPAQWAALRYLDRANASARTVTELARAQSVSKGAASQIISTLRAQGLLTIVPVPDDLRQKQIDLTPAGRDHLIDDPLNPLAEALGPVPDQQLEDMAGIVEILIRSRFTGDLNDRIARERMKRAQRAR